MKLGLLVKSRTALIKLYNSSILDAVVAYRISKNANAIFKELDLYDKQNCKLVNKYCNRDSNGKPVVKDGLIEISNIEKYEDELRELFKENVEISINKIPLGSISNVGLTPAEILSLEYMLDVEE